MKIKALHHIAIIVSNYETSKKFYTEILGFSIIHETYRKERDSYKLDLALHGKYIIELFSFPHPPVRLTNPEATGLRHIAFSVDSVIEEKKELEIKGIFVEEIRIDDISGKKYTFFKDPDGLPIEIYENA